ncbi:Electron transfer flavoprotein small subunit [Limihaloglobus sulfuriphilus]|uniref:Electron transfer flavoprotein small subunit n=1 Tax=Limihaloglobus sulfuriphilus TaxID=1851148 RepID=A0A1Q2MD49_9BACT|nr:electron transfer flavoprotein subunit beta/FixA family protein [Limihaloglobus sulfuriphilus]AQQ70579.1 Electron transfer flavoprotein small subunit [Limihaloglobus sulfuriphilus]
MSYKCVVLVKQVPDTARITGEAMNEDGTVNRAALPAIFNPEDLNALELAIQIKERFGGTVTVVTMGLPAAAEILKQSLFRGADETYLVTDRRCAASDTLATSYILSQAVKKIGYDIVLCGRQAIDGDTAQVGPQTAEKLGIPQVTYVEELKDITEGKITARRSIGNGWQDVKTTLPVLLTVTDEANEPRVAGALNMMKYKKAKTSLEVEDADEAKTLEDKGLLIKVLNLDDIEADLQWCGRDGSPTKVHRIMSVVLTAKETREVEPTEEGISEMVHELIVDHTIG